MVYSNEYKIGMEDKFRDAVKNLFCVLAYFHKGDLLYTLSEEAKMCFYEYHDKYYLVQKAIHHDDDNRRGVLSKSLGFVLRLSGILRGLQNAASIIEGTVEITDNEQDIGMVIRI